MFGLTLLAAPDEAARLLGAAPHGPHPLLRVLGLRHVVQAATLLARPTRGVVQASLALDGAHVASCLLYAAVDRANRRPALRDALLEMSLLLATRRSRPRPSARI